MQTCRLLHKIRLEIRTYYNTYASRGLVDDNLTNPEYYTRILFDKADLHPPAKRIMDTHPFSMRGMRISEAEGDISMDTFLVAGVWTLGGRYDEIPVVNCTLNGVILRRKQTLFKVRSDEIWKATIEKKTKDDIYSE